MNKLTNTRILIADDEPSIRNLLNTSFSDQGFITAEAGTGAEALNKATSFHPQMIILDLGLPDMNGLEVLRRLRTWSDVPVVVLTVDDDENSKVRLLDDGADDYLCKPFSMPELMARVRVGLRHLDAKGESPVFRSGDLQIDLNERAVSVAGSPVKLTGTEYELLRVLIRNQGRVVPQGQILQAVWGPNALNQSHYLRVYVAQLRKKIEIDPSAPRHILTEAGVGYRIN